MENYLDTEPVTEPSSEPVLPMAGKDERGQGHMDSEGHHDHTSEATERRNMLLFRPEYYRIFEDFNYHDLHGLEEVIMTGNKYGDTGEVWLKYNEALDTVRYMDQNKMKPSHIKRT